MAELPLLRRFPALARLPRAALGTFPTPVERLEVPDHPGVWIKRDDRSGALLGGNKLRALEWLLGGVKAGDEILTVGPRGSNHALATSFFARRLGARTTVVRWDQEMNPAARAVDARIRAEARVIDARLVPAAYAIALFLRARSRVRWIPAGGTTPLGVLGYVNAGLELSEQVARGDCPAPARVVVPLGTGGTAAGVALGLRIAGIRTRVIAVRVVPRIVAGAARVTKLSRDTTKLIERETGERLPPMDGPDVRVESAFYGGGYGRVQRVVPGQEGLLAALGIQLDDTYSRKAFAAAMAERGRGGATLFWLTFDGRLLQD